MVVREGFGPFGWLRKGCRLRRGRRIRIRDPLVGDNQHRWLSVVDVIRRFGSGTLKQGRGGATTSVITSENLLATTGDAYIHSRVTEQRSVASAFWIIVRSPCRDPEISRSGSGISTLDTSYEYWRGTNQAFGVWIRMARSLSVGVTTIPLE